MAIEIVATVVPGPAGEETPGNSGQNFFVYLTPRISYSGIGMLHHFKHVYNWPDYFCYFFKRKPRIVFYDDGHNEIGREDLEPSGEHYRGNAGEYTEEEVLAGKIISGATPADPANNLVRAWKTWRAMFDFDVNVDGWELDKTAFKLLKKLSTDDANAAMNKVIRAAKIQLNRKSLKELGIPGIFDSPGEEQRVRNSLLDILNHLLTLSTSEKIASPYINNTSSRIPFPGFLKRLRDALVSLEHNREQELQDLSLRLSLAEVNERNTTETNEFHKKMAAYGNFPFLLKQTGWIWKYTPVKKLAATILQHAKYASVEFADASPEKNKDAGNVQLPAGGKSPSAIPCPHCGKSDCDLFLQDFQSNINFLYPHTAVETNRNEKIVTRFRPNNAASKDQQAFFYLNISDGYIGQQPDLYSFTADIIEKNQQFERISKYLKQKFDFTPDPAEPAGNLFENEKLQDRRAGLVGEPEKDLLVLSDERERLKQQFLDFTSCGISLRLKQIADLAKMAIGASPNLSGGPENIAVIHGHNIHKGYRVDVIYNDDNGKKTVRSLCKRTVNYVLKANEEKTVQAENEPVDKNYFKQFCLCDDDEGWILESMQGSRSQAVYIDEELFRWNDWSLCADPIARGNEYSAKKPIDSDNVRVYVFPQLQSLPPLRFGEPYNFALRFVDITGGSVDSSNLSIGKAVLAKDIIYNRVQGITSPLVTLGHPLHKKSDRKNDYLDECYGEDVNTLMIRSYFDEENSRLQFETKTTTIRYIGPPKLDLNMVKKHKLFDALMKAVAGNAPVKNVSKEFLAFTSLPKKYHDHADDADTKEEVMLKNKNVPYLFDPLVSGYAFSINGKAELNSILIQSGSLLYFRNVWFKQVTLSGLSTSGDYSFFHQNENDLTLLLQQGMEKRLTITCQTDVAGMSASKADLQLVHAVEKPCLLDTDVNGKKFLTEYSTRPGEIKLLRRPKGGIEAGLTMFFDQFPCITSEAFILHACHLEIVATRKRFLSDGSVNTTGFEYKQVNHIVRTGVKPDRADTEQAVYFSGIQHTFNDTKARKIFYSLEAISKFKRFFRTFKNDPKDRFSIFGYGGNVADKPAYIDPDTSETDIKKITNENVAKRKNWMVLNSSEAPPPPKVDAIVPLIRWEGSLSSKSGLKRISDTIRIYFDEDWFVSGEDEHVALFFAEQDDARSSNVPKGLENVLSQLGNDPASIAPSDPSKEECGEKIRMITEKMLGKEKEYIDLFFSNLDFENRAMYKNKPCRAAIYKVDFMPSEEENGTGRYFIDVKLNDETLNDLYFPFLRFAIARYQPNTIDTRGSDGKEVDSHFSKPVITDFVQLLPCRAIKIDDKVSYKAHSLPKRPEERRNIVICRNLSSGDQVMLIDNYETNYQKGEALETLKFTDLKNLNKDMPWVIEEYEDYHSVIPVKDGQPAHADFKKRLVFSYLKKN